MDLAERISGLRTARKLSQDGLARLADLPISTLRAIEQRATTDPKLSTVRKLAAALGVKPSRLVD